MKKSGIISTVVLAVAVLAAGLLFLNRSPKMPQHIILISIDTCRADHLSCYGFPMKTTPHIDEVASGAFRFNQVISPVPITLPTHSTMLTGTIPPYHGVHDNVGYQLAPSNITLPELLKPLGYRTSAIVSAMVLDQALGLGQGFDTYQDTFEDEHSGHCGNERKADKTTEYALEWLEEHKSDKGFLFLHYYDPHAKYDPPKPFRSRFSDNLYAGEIAFTDYCIGHLISRLKALKLYDSALLIITSDHGEMLGEHGEKAHTFFIYESAIKVPLIIKMPGQKRGAVIEEPVGLVDLLPTLCAHLDIEMPDGLHGENLAPLMTGEGVENYSRHIYSETIRPTRFGAAPLMALSTGRWKYIQAPRAELYDVSEDPGELNNLIEQEHHRARILKDRLHTLLQSSRRENDDNRIEMDPETLKRLQSLGYIAGKQGGEIAFDEEGGDPKDYIHAVKRYRTGESLMTDKRYEEARMVYEELLTELPDFHELYMQIGTINMIQGNMDEGILNFRKSLDLEADQVLDPAFYNNLAWIQATSPSLSSRDLDEALGYSIKACSETSYMDPGYLDTLAVVYAARGEFDNAVKTGRKARKIALDAGDQVMAEDIQRHIERFERNEPYIDE